MTKHLAGRAPNTSQGLQTVFRVKGTKVRTKSVITSDERQKSSFNARRSHKKSRSGCQNCKLRRVKCDETRLGGCHKCRQHGVDCDYLNADIDKPISSVTTPSTHSALILPDILSGANTPTNWSAVALCPALRPVTPLAYDLPSDITPYWQTLRQFELFTCPTISSPDGKKIFETAVLAIANQSDYLMHAVLGTAAAHLRWQTSLRDSPAEYRKHQQAEAYHWHRAIGIFRTKLATIGQKNNETVDALISTCMLLGIHSYLLAGESDEISFIWKPESDRRSSLGWLSVQSGFGLLLRGLGGRAALSVWLEVFNSAARNEQGLQEGLDTARGIFGDFLELCAIDQQSSPTNNPYFIALSDLFGLLQTAPLTMANFAPLMAFMGRLIGPFQQLLVRRDPAALLIVAYWLTLMDQLDLWWIHERARRECTAIVTFLKGHANPLIRRMLQLPAETMNISLHDD